MVYNTSAEYSPSHDAGIKWDSLGFDWCVDSPIVCEVLVHLASHTPNPPYALIDECMYWNVIAAMMLTEQAHGAGIGHFVVAGSCFEYGRAAERRQFVDADTPLGPTLSYPASKAAATVAFDGSARLHGVKLKHARIFQVYGEGEQASRLWPALRKVAAEDADFPMSACERLRRRARCRCPDPGAPQFRRRRRRLAVRPCDGERPETLVEFAGHWWRQWGATGRLLPGALPYRHNEIMRLAPRPDWLASA